MKGIVLAGGSGTRLYPITKSVSKQLLPVYDKPMIYYPLSVLMLAGIKDILLITTPEDRLSFQNLLGDGSEFGIKLTYEIQPTPGGLAQAFIIGEKFIGDDNVCCILGDNIFYGQGLKAKLDKASLQKKGATIFSYKVFSPEHFGVVELDENKNPISIEEKPTYPKSNLAITGLYFYDNKVIDIAKNINPSHRGELEITDVNKVYLNKGELNVEVFGRGFAWLDTGTHDSLIEASEFIHTVEKRQGFKVSCLEEIAYRNGWITKEKLIKAGKALVKTEYGKYLLDLSKGL